MPVGRAISPPPHPPPSPFSSPLLSTYCNIQFYGSLMSSSPDANGNPGSNTIIPFAFFDSLIKAISSIKPNRAGQTKKPEHGSSRIVQTVNNWVAELHRRYSPWPNGTTSTFFRLIFPEEDVARKYGLQETLLARYLAEILNVSTEKEGRGRALKEWNDESSLGCLGVEVEKILKFGPHVEESTIPMSRVDTLLTELACTCAYSSKDIRLTFPHPRKRKEILKELYRNLSPHSAGIVTQIILKDLRPILYPLPETHYTTSLLSYNSKSLKILTKEEAMKAWDPSGRLLRAYFVRSSLDAASDMYEAGDGDIKPRIGQPVTIPKCVKAHSTKHALSVLSKSKRVWVENKYDGERAQIHVELGEDMQSDITIFSKSRRDSTLDRFGIHSLIREALGLPDRHDENAQKYFDNGRCKIKKNIIIEAEMVAYSDTLDKIDEFWRIRSLIASTAMGVRHREHLPGPQIESQDYSQCSLASNGSNEGDRHLALVFFDILFLDGVSLLSTPYSRRRFLLESVINLIPRYAMLANRTAIDLPPTQPMDDAEDKMRHVFASLIANSEEGAVLKADEARYIERRLPWVKLKRDYIPGYGDAVDLVLIGAGWDKERARTLAVAPTVYTTFYVGVLANAALLKRDPTTQPHFEVIFTTSYGLSREGLEEFNFLIKSSDPIQYSSHRKVKLPYTFNLYSQLPAPVVLFPTPVLAEVFGAGFTKPPQYQHYELRFPRISKIYRSNERNFLEGVPLEEYRKVAYESVGRDRHGKDEEDWCNALWGKPSSPKHHSAVKKRQREQEWVEKLEKVDETEGGVQPRPSRDPDAVPEDCVNGKDRDAIPFVNFKSPATRSRTPARLKTFGSVTNLVITPSPTPTPRQSFQSLPVPQPMPLSALRTGSSSIGRVSDNTENAQVSSDVILSSPLDNKFSSPLAQSSLTPRIRPKSEVASPKMELNSTMLPLIRQDTQAVLPQLYPSSSSRSTISCSNVLSSFLEDAIVFLARPSEIPRPLWRMPSRQLIPKSNQVSTLDAFLAACGWSSDQEPCSENSFSCSNWVKRGVIFVDDVDGREKLCEYPIKQLMERQIQSTSAISVHGSLQVKPVWVLGMSLMRDDKQNLLECEGDIERFAICKLG
ncbi:ATP-dependent DNA ligase family protein [Abortiporus biennis]